jgi:hypothetical protein
MLTSTNRSHVSPPATLAVAGTAWWWHASVAVAPVPGLSHHIVQKNAEVGLPASTSTIESTVTRNTGLLCSSSGKDEANEALREFSKRGGSETGRIEAPTSAMRDFAGPLREFPQCSNSVSVDPPREVSGTSR